MSPLDPLGPSARLGPRPAPGAVRLAEKSSASSGLNQGRQEQPKDPQREPRRLQVELVCQGGTAPHDPFWDGPRIRPAFAAQLLGQVMGADHAQAAAQRAYDTQSPVSARLLDTSL